MLDGTGHDAAAVRGEARRSHLHDQAQPRGDRASHSGCSGSWNSKTRSPMLDIVPGLGPGLEQGTINADPCQPLGSHPGGFGHSEVGKGHRPSGRLALHDPHIAFPTDLEVGDHRAMQHETRAGPEKPSEPDRPGRRWRGGIGQAQPGWRPRPIIEPGTCSRRLGGLGQVGLRNDDQTRPLDELRQVALQLMRAGSGAARPPADFGEGRDRAGLPGPWPARHGEGIPSPSPLPSAAPSIRPGISAKTNSRSSN